MDRKFTENDVAVIQQQYAKIKVYCSAMFLANSHKCTFLCNSLAVAIGTWGPWRRRACCVGKRPSSRNVRGAVEVYREPCVHCLKGH